MTSGEGTAPSGGQAVDDAIARMRAVADEGRSGAAAPGAAGTVDADVLRTALATLGDPEQRILWDHHVLGRSVDTVADSLGMHVRAAARRLRKAEEQLAAALSASHARGVVQQVCAETRGALHDYVGHRLGGGRRAVLEDHLFGCAGCLRAFVDVRETSWALRDAAPVLLGPLAASGVSVPVVLGAAGASGSAGAAGWFAGAGAGVAAFVEWVVRGARRLLTQPVGLAAGAAAAVVAVAAVAMSLAPGGTPAGLPVPVAASPSADTPEEAAPTAPAEPGPTASPADVTPTPSAAPEADGDDGEPEAADVGAREQAEPGVEADAGSGAGPDDAEAPEDDGGRARPDATVEPDVGPAPEPDPEEDQSDGTVPDTSDVTPGPEDPGGSDETEETVAPPPGPEVSRPKPEPSEPVKPPEPEPVTASLTLRVGGFGWFRVVPTDGGEIVSVTGGNRTEISQDRQGRWWVRTIGSRERDVTVEVRGEAGSEPGARLSFFGLER
ncbi:zf-HC2 domain-containing protein [Isoptericola jiangsuensis]|uniref:zf-HC2 domain-containing protein n=1 Tax=Isoptericola jiangsuensis TaxID=548579 RepID=UPI003AACE10A